MSLLEELKGAERRTWSDERGALTMVRVREGVALMVMEGKLAEEAAAAWEQQFAWLTGTAKLKLFIDGAAVTLPGSAFISMGTNLVSSLRPRLDDMLVLVSGSLLEMIAKTVNLTLGGQMRITRDRAQFDAAVRKAAKPSG